MCGLHDVQLAWTLQFWVIIYWPSRDDWIIRKASKSLEIKSEKGILLSGSDCLWLAL